MKSFIKHILLYFLKTEFINNFIENNIKKIEYFLTKAANEEFYKNIKQLQILSGPFKGIKLINADILGGVIPPKILDTYESELHDIIEQIIETKYDVIIDIGSAEGYYVMGFASRMKDVKIIGFEKEESNRKICMELVKANNIKNEIEYNGFCDPESLKKVLKKYEKGLIICDIEGGEVELLDPSKLNELKNFDILLELHELNTTRRTVYEEFLERFCSTHTIKFVNVVNDKKSKILDKYNLSPNVYKRILSEYRYFSIGWMFMQVKNIKGISTK